jgi:hypothetical protein
VPVAAATILAVALIVASGPVSQVSGEGDAAVLRSVNEHGGSLTFSSLLQVFGFALLAAPLVYLFRVVRARSNRVRTQLIGLVVAAPLFLAISAGLTIGAREDAADAFVSGDAKPKVSAAEAKDECASELDDLGKEEFGEEFEPGPGESALKACEDRQLEDGEAENAIGEASLAPLVSGLGLAGGLGFVVALFYTCLWAMRTGVLTRFWGSLGMVAGIAFLLGPLFFVTLVWFVYFGLLVLGLIPGGRPPAWEEGRAVPWPTPGEKAAAELQPSDPDAVDVDDTDVDSGEPAEPTERRKRKQRD